LDSNAFEELLKNGRMLMHISEKLKNPEKDTKSGICIGWDIQLI